jgi:dTDP-glucose pyrophosphorylase
MINIVIPMAGLGTRFASAGYQDPKPLIPVHGVPMIRLVIENIRPQRDHQFIFICQQDHLGKYNLAERLRDWAPRAEIIALSRVTDGAARTVMLARDYIDNDVPLMIANSDQYVDTNIDKYLIDLDASRLDGLIMTMEADDPKWSFVATSEDNLITRVVEKEVISRRATVGIYNFAAGKDFVRGAETMIRKEIRINNEFYVAPVYNELIAEGARIGFYDVGHAMYGLGIPEDLNTFLRLPLSRRITNGLS